MSYLSRHFEFGGGGKIHFEQCLVSVAVASLVDCGVWLKTDAHIGLSVPVSVMMNFQCSRFPFFWLFVDRLHQGDLSTLIFFI
jgi:hypothetical protein